MRTINDFIFILGFLVILAGCTDKAKEKDQGGRGGSDVSSTTGSPSPNPGPAPMPSQTPGGNNGGMPSDFKVAFIADGGGTKMQQGVPVLNLIKAEKAQLVIHAGDFDYGNNPTDFENAITQVLGANFPYLISIGNHDVAKWTGISGYQALAKARIKRAGITCTGDYGVKSSCLYKGLHVILSGVGSLGSGHETYLTSELQKSTSLWKVCTWHKNQHNMQCAGKPDEVGWQAYEICRQYGAIIATGHDHTYCRSHLLSNMQAQTVASTSNILNITKGKTFVFTSGLAGRSLPDSNTDSARGAWWAKVHTLTTDPTIIYGALFCTLNVGGVVNKGHCYFKDIRNRTIDQFEILNQTTTQSIRELAVEQPSSPTTLGRAMWQWVTDFYSELLRTMNTILITLFS